MALELPILRWVYYQYLKCQTADKVRQRQEQEVLSRSESVCPEHNLLCCKILDLGLPGCTLQQYLGLLSWEAQSFLHFRKHTMNNEVKRSFPLPSKSFLLCVHPPHRNQGRIVIRVFVIPLENIVDVSKERLHRKTQTNWNNCHKEEHQTSAAKYRSNFSFKISPELQIHNLDQNAQSE